MCSTASRSPRAARWRYAEKYPASQLEQDTRAKRSRSGEEVAAGAVRVRPTAERAPPRENRKKYVVAGASPLASTLTVWSRSGPVTVEPCATTRRKSGSVATCQATVTRGPEPDPGRASAVGVTRVHSTTASGSGSPDAIPWRNRDVAQAAVGEPVVEAAVAGRARAAPTPSAAAVAAEPARKVRRSIMVTDPQRPPWPAGDGANRGVHRAFTRASCPQSGYRRTLWHSAIPRTAAGRQRRRA